MKRLTKEDCLEKMRFFGNEEIDLIDIKTKQRIKQGKTINETFCVCKCRKCGNIWEAASYNLFKRKGTKCPECSHPSKKKTTEKFIEEAKKTHGNKYSYEKTEYVNKNTNLTIICPIHGEFQQNPSTHLQGCGCPKCKRSKLEERVEHLLNDNSIEFINQYKTVWLGKQSLDFYIPSKNIAIECQGEQHFKEIHFGNYEFRLDYYKRLDELKYKKCIENNVNILYFSNTKYADNIITNESELLKILTE